MFIIDHLQVQQALRTRLNSLLIIFQNWQLALTGCFMQIQSPDFYPTFIWKMNDMMNATSDHTEL